MNNVAAISAINCALAKYRRRQANAPTDHSAREVAQMSMLAEYLHETPLPDIDKTEPHSAASFMPGTIAVAA